MVGDSSYAHDDEPDSESRLLPHRMGYSSSFYTSGTNMVMGNQQARRRHHHVDSSSSPSMSILPALHPPHYNQRNGGEQKRSGRIVSVPRKQNISKFDQLRKKSKRRGIRLILLLGGAIILLVYGTIFFRLKSVLTQDSRNIINPPLHHKQWFQRIHKANRLKEYISSEKSTMDVIRQRQTQRRKRTRIISTNEVKSDDDFFASYELGFMNENDDEPVLHAMRERIGETYKSSTRCGVHAQNAFSANPSSYPDIHSIHEGSIVLITGILNRLGFHLALKLASQCNVKVLIGVDSFYPNESKHKLQLLNKLSILYSQLPNFKVPLINVFDGVNPRRYRNLRDYIDERTGDFDYATFSQPSHVVHLLSAEENAYLAKDGSIGSDSPYELNDGLFGLRQSLAATEQLLKSLGDISQVHFTIASDVDVLKLGDIGLNGNKEGGHRRGIFTMTKIMEETLLRSYSTKLKDSSFVTLRFPKLYGPWGDPESFDYRLAQKAIAHWHDKGTMERELDSESILLQLTGQSEQSQYEHDILFVDDAVDAIVTAMQFRDPDSNAVSFNAISGEKTTSYVFADFIESYMPTATHVKRKPQIDETHDENGNYIIPEIAAKMANQLHWTPKTFLREGVKHLLSWHLGEHLPFDPKSHPAFDEDFILSATETEHSFVIREGGEVCDPNDIYCLRGHQIFPCASECSDPYLCTKSSYDRVAELSRQLTEKCEIVLYMAIIDEKITKIPITAPAEDDSEASICSIAYIPKSSKLVQSILEDETDVQNSFSYQGWEIVTIDFPDDKTPWTLGNIVKMSPGKFFHSSVKSALYIPQNFSTDPEVADIIFTTGLLRRPTGIFSSYKALDAMDKMNYKIGKSAREALIVMPGPLTVEKDVDAVFRGSVPTTAKKMNLDRALKTLIIDQNSEISKRHVQFERGINSFFYNSHDFGPITYKFYHQHWTRNQWVAHNLEKVEGQNLRCEWYREHAKWNDSNGNLSFAHVMGRQDVNRFNNLFNEEDKIIMQEDQRNDDVPMETDSYQWQRISDKDSNNFMYARIVDDRSLIIERRLWNKFHYLTKVE